MSGIGSVSRGTISASDGLPTGAFLRGPAGSRGHAGSRERRPRNLLAPVLGLSQELEMPPTDKRIDRQDRRQY